MEGFLQLVSENGLQGLIVGVLVLGLVFGLNRAGVVVTQGQKQSANVVLSIVLSGLSLLDPSMADAVTASLASLGSALLYEGIKFLLGLKAKG